MFLWDVFRYILPSSLVVILLGFTWVCVQLHRKHVKYSHIPGPERTSFFMGNIGTIRHAVVVRKVILYHLLFELQQQYGPVFVMFVFHRPVLFAYDPATVKELLTNSVHTKPNTYDKMDKLHGVKFLGKGLVTERNHAKWSVRRRIINPAFHRKKLMNLMGQFNECADELVLKFKQDADTGEPVALMDGFNRVTLNVIAKAAFGMQEELMFENSPFIEAVEVLFKAMLRKYRNPLEWLDPRTRSYRNGVRESLLFLRRYGEALISRCIRDRRDGHDAPDNILNSILQSFETSNEKVEMEKLVDEFVTFFVAGQETTGNLLGFVMLELSKRPDIAARVKDEVDTIFGEKKFIDYQGVMKMEYTNLVLKETLRLYPPVPGTSRDNAHDITVCGYNIPAGTTIQLTHFIFARMEEFFKDPLVFDPERFTKEDDTPLYAYFPFALGERSCIGQQFALIETRVILAKLLQNFEFKLDETQSFGIADKLTLSPEGNCMNYIYTRERGVTTKPE